MKKRIGDPWMPADDYGRSLPELTVNLLVRDVAKSVSFYRTVLDATVHYSDEDFAAIRLGSIEMMLHADHTYDHHPWYPRLVGGDRRGLGAELRFFGTEPEKVEAKARVFGSPILQPTTTKAHGWRDVIVEDPDGYAWAIGVPTPK
jgi:catechol 2,3-dioxygenase-like lactoylglutathione lyase family enzyme